MKKDRNCGNYPVYPNYGEMMSIPATGVQMPMPMPMGMPGYVNGPGNFSSNNLDFNSLFNKINSLEQRINNLENMYSNNYSSNNYNSSNYQMM